MVEETGNSEESGEPESARFTQAEAKNAQDALTHRPRISIRLRIALGFLVTFVFTCGITIAAMVFISTIANRQHLLESAGNLEFEIQQARRYEKNWFLYGTNLYDALNNVQTAENVLNSSRDEWRQIVGSAALDTMLFHLNRYRETLEQLGRLGPATDSNSTAQRLQLESGLREFGAKIVTEASNVVDQERLRIHTWLTTSMVIAVAALIIYLIFIAFIAFFITKQIIRPFGRFEGYTRRIAGGDFTLIKPTRKYRDEFTNLAIALNHMLIELNRHEQQLIQSRKMAAIGNLTAGIAHELNNPLNNIGITAEALIEEFDSWSTEDKLKMLRTIETQVERASNTVANLLDFTRRDESSFEAISINDVLTRTVKLMSNEINLNNTELDLQLSNNLPPVHGSAHNLQQVFLNLILNALQAMPDKGNLRIKSYAEDDSVRIDVSDTGIGIPRENLDKIFDPFYTTKEVGKGTGLGLSVSYGIIKKHHGRVSVTSETGQGTTFSVILPVAGTIGTDERPQEVPESSQERGESGEQRN
jgi:two-component system NtrC family sensor kinase